MRYTQSSTVRLVSSWAPISEPAPEIICGENGVEVLDYTGTDVPEYRALKSARA